MINKYGFWFYLKKQNLEHFFKTCFFFLVVAKILLYTTKHTRRVLRVCRMKCRVSEWERERQRKVDAGESFSEHDTPWECAQYLCNFDCVCVCCLSVSSFLYIREWVYVAHIYYIHTHSHVRLCVCVCVAHTHTRWHGAGAPTHVETCVSFPRRRQRERQRETL